MQGNQFDDEAAKRITRVVKAFERNPDALIPVQGGEEYNTQRPIENTPFATHVFVINSLFGYRMFRSKTAWYRFVIDDFAMYGPFAPDSPLSTVGAYELDSIQFTLGATHLPFWSVPQRNASETLDSYYSRWTDAFAEQMKLAPSYNKDKFKLTRDGALIQFTFGGTYSPSQNPADRPTSTFFFDKVKFKEKLTANGVSYFGPPSNQMYIAPFHVTMSEFYYNPNQEQLTFRQIDAQKYMTWEWGLAYTEGIAIRLDTGEFALISTNRRTYPVMGILPTEFGD
jgi:hypothetical protein